MPADASKIVHCRRTHLCNFRAAANIDLRVLKVMKYVYGEGCQTLTQKRDNIFKPGNN